MKAFRNCGRLPDGAAIKIRLDSEMLEECHVGLADAVGVGDVFPVGRRARKADPTSVVK